MRPDDWNFPLLLHVLGAMVFTALLAALAVILVVALRGGSDRRDALLLSSRLFTVGIVPSYLLMRIAAEWILSKENADEDAVWIGIGYIATDMGLLVLIVVGVLLGISARRLKRDREPGRLAQPAMILTLLLIATYAVALWAMTTKPT
ncbi:MAG: hypothetical protein JW895_14495 [Thermoleophilaceae bacterium]|nr:hypothetical protein [Thermoleophilaceae bacterium]